eukprot:10424413-Lingulodinium_polyedra.AAC.1
MSRPREPRAVTGPTLYSWPACRKLRSPGDWCRISEKPLGTRSRIASSSLPMCGLWATVLAALTC